MLVRGPSVLPVSYGTFSARRVGRDITFEDSWFQIAETYVKVAVCQVKVSAFWGHVAAM